MSVYLQQFISNLTSDPGIYQMLDKYRNVLYVGKASNLKKRVNSYFTQSNLGIKTRTLVRQIDSIEITVTRSETEALLLECNLIKSLRPKYNVLMRDDKSYPYIHVSESNAFPRFELVRFKQKPLKGEYYGPYPSVTAVRETLSIIQKIFKIRNCSDSFFAGRSRPCLQYQIKRCSAPCVEYITVSEYQRSFANALRFLQGKSQQVIDELMVRMEEAVKRLSFEEATVLRDQIKHLRLVQEQQGVVQLRGDVDVIVIHAQPGFACIQCVTIRQGEVLASQSFFPSVPKQSFVGYMQEVDLWQEVFIAFLAFYYFDTPKRIPSLILTDRKLVNQKTIQLMLTDLSGKACRIKMNSRGVHARWLDFALNNLQKTIAERVRSVELIRVRYQMLCEVLQCDAPIKRMECFDISHTQGAETVASCVVFDENGPCKCEYRHFNIHGITPGDDYAAMEQVITRRYKRLIENQRLPDVLIIDGGLGQVNRVRRFFSALQITGVKLLGLAKGPDRKAGLEKLIFCDERHEIILPSESPALHLLQQIRDEAHRFAITQHRKKRGKSSLKSSLLAIEGIGAKRHHALLQRFGGLSELAKAPVSEMIKVRGISEEIARRIYVHFHPL